MQTAIKLETYNYVRKRGFERGNDLYSMSLILIPAVHFTDEIAIAQRQ